MKKEEDYIKNLINDFKQDRNIISRFLIKEKQLKKSKQQRTYIELELQDKTGQIRAVMFAKRPKQEYEKIQKGRIYNLNGEIREYPENSGKYNILINKIMPAKKYNMEDYIKTVQNYDEQIKQLEETIKSVHDPDMHRVLESFFNNPEFKDKFINVPAAKTHHHNYKGGLLVHTNEVISICRAITGIYHELDHDLLITGAILHDMGKIKTYTYTDDTIDINYEGRMLDHLYMGAKMLEDNLEKLEIPQKKKTNLIHMILAHHGETSLGWGSTVDPKIPEATVLHYADDISAKLTKELQR